MSHTLNMRHLTEPPQSPTSAADPQNGFALYLLRRIATLVLHP